MTYMTYMKTLRCMQLVIRDFECEKEVRHPNKIYNCHFAVLGISKVIPLALLNIAQSDYLDWKFVETWHSMSNF